MAKSDETPDEFEIVNESDLNFARRGRKSTFDPKLANAIAKLPAGKVLTLPSYKVDLKGSTAKTRKASVSAMIRSAAKSVGVKVRIAFTLDGVPTVRLVTSK
ncbi:hypothetical protein EB001_00450 [bacterium]|nr:hypothetical protein [bacterium]